MISRHVEYTRSARGKEVLARWVELVPKFVKVYPNDYRRVVEAQKRAAARGLQPEEAVMAAFLENTQDLMRAAGN